MKIETNSVLTVVVDDLEDRDFLIALKKISKRDETSLEKALGNVVSNFLSTGGEPPFLPIGGEPPQQKETLGNE